MKNLFKKISIMLSFTITLTFVSPILEAKAYESSENYLANINNYENNSEIPDLILSEEEIKLANEYIQKELDNGNIVIMPRSITLTALAGLAGTFFIPGVGTAIITTAGKIIVGGATIAATSWLGKKVAEWVYNSKKNDAEKASDKIPKSLKKGNGDVDVNKFTQKVKGKQEWKDPKTGWSIDKDTTNHRGYDGSVKKWKIKNPKGTRVGSLNSNGKVIDN